MKNAIQKNGFSNKFFIIMRDENILDREKTVETEQLTALDYFSPLTFIFVVLLMGKVDK
jgi:hypothetical protein